MSDCYPHMCRDGHPEIGHSTDGERCPVCLERDRAEQAEAEVKRLRHFNQLAIDLDVTKTARIVALEAELAKYVWAMNIADGERDALRRHLTAAEADLE